MTWSRLGTKQIEVFLRQTEVPDPQQSVWKTHPDPDFIMLEVQRYVFSPVGDKFWHQLKLRDHNDDDDTAMATKMIISKAPNMVERNTVDNA